MEFLKLFRKFEYQTRIPRMLRLKEINATCQILKRVVRPRQLPLDFNKTSDTHSRGLVNRNHRGLFLNFVSENILGLVILTATDFPSDSRSWTVQE